MWIFLLGNISNGFTAIGPFADADECADKCEAFEGWMMELTNKLPENTQPYNPWQDEDA